MIRFCCAEVNGAARFFIEIYSQERLFLKISPKELADGRKNVAKRLRCSYYAKRMAASLFNKIRTG
jgi:hypothetical protein